MASFIGVPELTAFPGPNEDPLREGGAWNGPLHPAGLQLSIISHTVGQPGVGNGCEWWTTPYGPDQAAWFELGTPLVADDDNYSLFLNIANPGIATETWYELSVTPRAGTDDWDFFKNVLGGGSTHLATLTGVNVAVGDFIGISHVGSLLSAYRQPSGGGTSLVGTFSDSSITAGGFPGIAVATGGTGNIRRFGAGSLSSSIVEVRERRRMRFA